MQATIHYIRQELNGIYPETEIRAFLRIILEVVCGLSYTRQIIEKDKVLPEDQIQKIREVIDRLKDYEPIGYILGETEFLDLRILLNPSVLIPRPETEELVLWAAETALPAGSSVLDIGTGSGCIALGLKKQMPECRVSACDIFEDALRVARKNAEINELDIFFFEADILTWTKQKWMRFNLIVSNPPYVRESEKIRMEPNVLQYEPQTALFVPDADPLLYYKAITGFARQYLENGGWLFFEINEALGYEMANLIEQEGFGQVEIRKDLSGRPRMLKCRKIEKGRFNSTGKFSWNL